MKMHGWKTCSALFLLCAAGLMTAQAQTFTTLLDFTVPMGAFPEGSLVQGRDGNFYGTTAAGGATLLGTVFKITASGELTTLYSFCNCGDGDNPNSLILATDGNFYGTAFAGGNQYGTVFRITPAGTLTTLHTFDRTDGGGPVTLTEALDGNLYGTSLDGGASGCNNCGTVFEITKAGKFISLHAFAGFPADGSYPYGALLQATDGNLYGTACGGGTQNRGTVYKLSNGVLSTVYNFNIKVGQCPEAGLVEAPDGLFYGTTIGGGPEGYGNIFRMGPHGVTILHNFDYSDGNAPIAPLELASDGNFYGPTFGGGNGTGCVLEYGCGTLFSTTGSGTFASLHDFGSTGGVNPAGYLLQSTSGVFYGYTTYGGEENCDSGAGCGIVYSFDMGLGPFVAFVQAGGKVGQTAEILGQGFTGTTDVSMNGVPATFNVVSDTYLTATVPSGATTGYVTVTAPSGVLKSDVPFNVIQ